MSTNHSGRRRRRALIAAIGAGLIPLLLAGCQSENRLASVASSGIRPTCEAVLHALPLGRSTSAMCRSCKRVSVLDESTRAKVERYVGGHVGETVHICERCESMSESCMVCQATWDRPSEAGKQAKLGAVSRTETGVHLHGPQGKVSR